MRLQSTHLILTITVGVILVLTTACAAPPVPEGAATAAPAGQSTAAVPQPTTATPATTLPQTTATSAATTAPPATVASTATSVPQPTAAPPTSAPQATATAAATVPATATTAPTVPPTQTGAATAAATSTTAPQATQVATKTVTAGAVTITDSAGRQVSFATPPTKIISLAPSTTEIVCALNACDKLIGIDQFSDFPAQVKSLTVFSNGFDPNYEQIVAAQPDLVLVAGITSPDVIQKLNDLKVPVVVVGAANESFDNIKSEIQMVGKVLGQDTQAQAVVADMNNQLDDVQSKLVNVTTKPRVYWELDATDPSKPYTPGPGSFVDEIITRAGGTNIASSASSPYPQVSAEEIIRDDPQVIVLSDAAYGIAPDSVGKRPGWDVISAVKDNKVFPIDDNLVSRPGPRVIQGLVAAAKLIHPELFGTASTATGGTQASYTDPFAYCGAVINVDAPAAPYTGAKVPDVVANGLAKAMGTPSAPDSFFISGTSWRCMNGEVFACNVGANIPCDSKANTNITPTQGEIDYCKQNPNDTFIPAYVTGHATVYEWSCGGAIPSVTKQVLEVDAQGYPAAFWYEIKQ